MRERLELPVWEKLATGPPVLPDALVSFDCRFAGVRKECTHWVILGAVQDVKTLGRIADSTPGCKSDLLYLNRSYRKLPLRMQKND
jgi:flavin reductase (DIM6/NTAB) family NADH-FMN oxidoreductase RutF